MKSVTSVVLSLLCLCAIALCQTETATISGRVTDPSGAVISSANVQVQNVLTGHQVETKTNSTGLYVAAALEPGTYRIIVSNPGFKQIVKPGVVLNVQDNAVINFSMQIGSASETVTVAAGGITVNTTDASVSTVVNRQFVDKMPLNGRSFQDLLTLSPGVTVTTSSGPGYSGEVTVNGQRTEANYFTVDGVSANTGTAPNQVAAGFGIAGGVPGETVLGTTHSLVSIDALQEFRATTSTYSAEYGRTPGGQFSLSTRSGTNAWHGSAYDYFRNEVMDANNWFNKCECLGLALTPRLPERQNDFGGSLGGPITIPGLYQGHDRTFFFFSYEGLRLRVPQPAKAYSVPDSTLRRQVSAALQPFLNVFPLPNGGEDGLNDGLAIFNLAYSAPSSVDSISVRVDHTVTDRLKIFGRYSHTPSSGWTYSGPAIKSGQAINVTTLTLGASSVITGSQANEVRFNLTQNNATNDNESTSFGGAIPLDWRNLPGPSGQPLQPTGSATQFCISYGNAQCWLVGTNRNAQRQYNLTDTYMWSVGAHQFRFGVDWRRLATRITPLSNWEYGVFYSQASLLANLADYAANAPFQLYAVEPVYHNVSTFAQDEWRVTSRLALSVGLRWEVNPAPGNRLGPSPYTVDQVTNLASTKLAPPGTPLWRTDWRGLAPRLGLAYQLRQHPGTETVVRGGIGTFYDTGNNSGSGGFGGAIGFTSTVAYSGVPFPLTSQQVTLPTPSTTPPYQPAVFSFDPKLRLPYTLQWNFAIQQNIGTKQTFTATYVGSGGRKLLATFFYYPFSLGNPNFAPTTTLSVTSNRASASYNALQVKYEKSLSRGLQVLGSYTFSHSIDDASTNFLVYELERASSDFDTRHNFQTAVTYDIPGQYKTKGLAAVIENWGVDWRISATSASPVDIVGSYDINPLTQQFQSFHPNIVPGQPLYVRSLQSCPASAGVSSLSAPPGGRIINICAFQPAPLGVEGNSGRNSARGFGAVQFNLALRRDFPIHERLHLQFRAEAFNLLNRPNFSGIATYLPSGPEFFGYATSTLNQQLGGLNSLYQTGGPRSLQLSLRLGF